MDDANSGSREALPPTATSEPDSAQAAGPRTAVLLALCAVALAFCVAQFDAQPTTAKALEAPPLPRLSVRCEATGEATAQRALEAEQAALAKIARYPYAATEGLRALLRLSEAKRCFEDAGDRVGMARVAQRALHWRARLERDYRDHLMRYRRALSTHQDGQLQLEIGVLLELLTDQQGKFVNQLRTTQLALAASENRTEER